MNAFVILAAGRGSRMGRIGDVLPKCLAPLQERAALTHIMAKSGGIHRVIIVTGYKRDLVEDYVAMMHPYADVSFVYADSWDQPYGGPGASLLAARPAVGVEDDMMFVSCDTIWEHTSRVDWTTSWIGVAPVPIGTSPARWCRVREENGKVITFHDKVHEHLDDAQWAYTGLGYIKKEDLQCFWSGIEDGMGAGELQVTGGLARVADHAGLHTEVIQWTDIGDEDAYHHALEEFSGYDWVKTGQVTYVEPHHRVVKFAEDASVLSRRFTRAKLLRGAVPPNVMMDGNFLGYDYVRGETAYDAIVAGGVDVTHGILMWWRDGMWSTRMAAAEPQHVVAAEQFYLKKTLERVEMLQPELRSRALDAVMRIDLHALAHGIIPGVFHGDFNFGNIIVTTGGYVGIDWREDFAGETDFGDLRYDLGKLIAGTVIHWGNARRGDFRVWPQAGAHYELIMRFTHALGVSRRDVSIIGALSLINSAPLHAAPLDEIAVTRACRWLERL